MIQRSPWCRHNDINAAFKGNELRSNRLTSIDCEYGNPLFFAIAMDGFAHLYRQFSCWHENESERILLSCRMGQALEKRERERGCLACSCRGVTQKVPSSQ
jgi:hypothetical protein